MKKNKYLPDYNHEYFIEYRRKYYLGLLESDEDRQERLNKRLGTIGFSILGSAAVVSVVTILIQLVRRFNG